MKKLLLLLSLSASLCAFAQGNAKFGVNAGTTLSDIRGDDRLDIYKNAVDFLVGLSMELPINDNLSVFANINYERKSVVHKIQFEQNPDFDPLINPNNRDKVNLRLSLQYLSIPVNIKYYIGSRKTFYIHGGPYAAVFLDDAFRFDGEKIDEISGGSDFKTVDFGLTLGAGAQIKLNAKHNLSIGIRDNFGLANVSDMDYRIRTNSLNLVVTFESIL